jgi:hypothetical protein
MGMQRSKGRIGNEDVALLCSTLSVSPLLHITVCVCVCLGGCVCVRVPVCVCVCLCVCLSMLITSFMTVGTDIALAWSPNVPDLSREKHGDNLQKNRATTFAWNPRR